MGPEELGRYRLRRVLGRGGRTGLYGGEVWEAEDTESPAVPPRRIALKIVRVDDEGMLGTQARLVDDARRLAGMTHRHVASVHDSGEAGGTCFLVMDLVAGKKLSALLADPEIATSDRVRWAREVARGLAAMHSCDVAHRDIKLENVVVREDGSACLVDLGICLDPSSQDGALDDQCAWAALARDLLGDAAPEHVARAIERAGIDDPMARFPSMEALADELEEARPEAPPGEPRSGAASSPRRTLPPVAAAIALGIVIALAVLLHRLFVE